MGVNGEALHLHIIYKKPYFLLQVTRESVSVLQITCAASVITIVPSYTGKIITRLLLLALLFMLRTRNNTDGNRLMMFSGIALYYSDTYITCYLGYHAL